MTTLSRSHAQQRADAIHTFRRELDRLEAEGVLTLTPVQQQAVDAHHAALLRGFAADYDIDRDQRAKQLSWGMRIASFLGALALSASVFFLFYQFWGLFSVPVQVALLIAAPLATLGLTLMVSRLDGSGYFTKLAAMVAFACFVLNIVMLGQIFNITPTDNALVAFTALALLLAYGLDQRLLLVAGIVCLTGFIAARAGTWSGMYWIHFGERPENFFPAALLFFILPSAIPHHRFSGFAATYRIFALLILLLPMLVLANWGYGSYLNLDPDLIEGGYQIAGFVLSAGAVWIGLRRGWPETVNTGVTFFVIFLYTKFYDWWWDIMPKYLFFLLIGLTALLFLLVLRRLRIAAGSEDAA